MQPGKNAMNEMSGTGGLSGQVVHDEGDGRPCYDLLQHPDHLPARAQRATVAATPSIAQDQLQTNGQPAQEATLRDRRGGRAPAAPMRR